MANLRRMFQITTSLQFPTSGRSAQFFSSVPIQTSEKNVPYQKTLKEGGPQGKGPTHPLPASVDVVVVGGGSVGCQTVYHLAKMGLTNVVLLERDRLTSGTTWHTAGLLWQLRPSDVEVELLAHTRDVVSQHLEQETGLHTGWVQNGGLFIASNKQRLDEYKRLMSLGKVYGVESHVLSPGETKDLYPLMNVDDLYGTLYVPKDGTMDPAGTCTSLIRAATARGALVIENCPVTGVEVRTDDLGVRRVAAVVTNHGTIQTPCVVNCAGRKSAVHCYRISGLAYKVRILSMLHQPDGPRRTISLHMGKEFHGQPSPQIILGQPTATVYSNSWWNRRGNHSIREYFKTPYVRYRHTCDSFYSQLIQYHVYDSPTLALSVISELAVDVDPTLKSSFTKPI